MSIRHTLCPARANPAERFTEVVVFPTPPFWLITAIERIAIPSASSSIWREYTAKVKIRTRSDLDRKIKEAAAMGEAAWEGIGQKPEVRVWRIEKFQVKPWPRDRYGEFHKGDSYIVMNSYRKGTSDALSHDIHIWIGSESSQDEYGTAGKTESVAVTTTS